MGKNRFKFFLAILVVFFILPSIATAVGDSSVNITSVRENIFSGRGVSVEGTALAGDLMRVGIYDLSNSLVHSSEFTVGNTGEWSVNFDQPLKSGKYYIEAIVINPVGEWGSLARSDVIDVRGPFAFIIAIFSALVLILTAVFVGGWYLSKRAERKRYQRILITERDIASSYKIMKDDVQRALQKISGGKFDEGAKHELEFLLNKTNDNLEKMNKYITKGINILSKYDIISKIDKTDNK